MALPQGSSGGTLSASLLAEMVRSSARWRQEEIGYSSPVRWLKRAKMNSAGTRPQAAAMEMTEAAGTEPRSKTDGSQG